MFFSRLMALRKRSLASLCVWPPRSCRLKPGLSPVTASVNLSMKRTQRKEIQEKTLQELLADGRNLRQEVFNLRLQQASAQLEKPARLHTLRRDIARIETRISALRNKAG